MAGFDIAPIVRTQDFQIIKQNEDIKSAVDQTNIAHVREQKENNLNNEVVNTSESEWYRKDPDAREKGSNEYAGDGGSERRNPNNKKKPVDKMIVKGRRSGFDLRI